MRPELRIGIPSRRVVALATILAVTMGALLVAAGDTDAFGAAAATSFTPCLPGTQPASVTVGRDADDTVHGSTLDAFTVSGLDHTGCNGSTVVLTISGNRVGDPRQPVTEQLGSYDSRLDPCTRQALPQPDVIHDGAITLTGCATGGPAQNANLHDATHLVLTVDGSTLPTDVLGETVTRTGSRAAVQTAVTDGAELPFTGSYAALTIWLGLLLLAVGIALSVLGRRHRDRAQPD